MRLALTRKVNLRQQSFNIFSRGNQRIREVIPNSLGKEAMLIGVCTSKGCLKCHRVLVSATYIFWNKVICRNSGFTSG